MILMTLTDMTMTFANNSRNWISHRFASVAEKESNNGTNKKSDTR